MICCAVRQETRLTSQIVMSRPRYRLGRRPVRLVDRKTVRPSSRRSLGDPTPDRPLPQPAPPLWADRPRCGNRGSVHLMKAGGVPPPNADAAEHSGCHWRRCSGAQARRARVRRYFPFPVRRQVRSRRFARPKALFRPQQSPPESATKGHRGSDCPRDPCRRASPGMTVCTFGGLHAGTSPTGAATRVLAPTRPRFNTRW